MLEDVIGYFGQLSSDPRPNETVILDRLVEVDPTSRAEVDAVDTSRSRAADAADELGTRLAASPKRFGDQRRDLEPWAAIYADELRALIERTDALLRRADQCLPPEDWDRIGPALRPTDDPLFDGEPGDELAALRSHYVQRVREIGRSSVPVNRLLLGAALESVGATLYGIGKIRSAVAAAERDLLAQQLRSVGEMVEARDLSGTARALAGLATREAATVQQSLARIRTTALRTGRGAIVPYGTAVTLDEARRVVRRWATLAPFRDWAQTDRRPSWRLQALDVGLRIAVKRTLGTGDLDSVRRFATLAERLYLPGPDGREGANGESPAGLDAEWVTDHEAAPVTILYLPGGGFVIPAGAAHRRLARRIARAADGARALLVHYRLAPENPFPAGLEDCVSAYRYLLDEGTEPGDIVVIGDSAGGGLTLSTLLSLRDRGLPLPAAAVVLSPLTDLGNTGVSRRGPQSWRDPMLPNHRRLHLSEIYLRDTPVDDPLASPVYGDYRGLPPILAQVGDTEILLDDTLRVARRARAAGVEVEVEVWNDLPHVWHVIGFLPEAQQAIERVGDFIATHTAPTAGRFSAAGVGSSSG